METTNVVVVDDVDSVLCVLRARTKVRWNAEWKESGTYVTLQHMPAEKPIWIVWEIIITLGIREPKKDETHEAAK